MMVAGRFWEVAVRRSFEVVLTYSLAGPAPAAAPSLPLALGWSRGEPHLSYTFGTRRRAHSAIDAESESSRELERLCAELGWPRPRIESRTCRRVNPLSRRGRGRALAVGGDYGDGTAGVREPRRPRPSGPPPARAAIEGPR
jgi:hypothetical protein